MVNNIRNQNNIQIGCHLKNERAGKLIIKLPKNLEIKFESSIYKNSLKAHVQNMGVHNIF